MSKHFDENFYADLEKEEVAIALQERGNPLQTHLQKVLKNRIKKEGTNWYEGRKVLQIGKGEIPY